MIRGRLAPRGRAGNRLARAMSLVALLLPVTTVAGCSADGLRFTRDVRVKIVSPRRLSTISPPVTFRWRSRLPASQRYALLLVQTMVSPGEPLTDLVPADGQCRLTGDCRTAEALAASGVYLATGTSVTVRELPSLPANQTSLEARLVLVDAAGRRDGESLWYTTLRLPKAAQ